MACIFTLCCPFSLLSNTHSHCLYFSLCFIRRDIHKHTILLLSSPMSLPLSALVIRLIYSSLSPPLWPASSLSPVWHTVKIESRLQVLLLLETGVGQYRRKCESCHFNHSCDSVHRWGHICIQSGVGECMKWAWRLLDSPNISLLK